ADRGVPGQRKGRHEVEQPGRAGRIQLAGDPEGQESSDGAQDEVPGVRQGRRDVVQQDVARHAAADPAEEGEQDDADDGVAPVVRRLASEQGPIEGIRGRGDQVDRREVAEVEAGEMGQVHAYVAASGAGAGCGRGGAADAAPASVAWYCASSSRSRSRWGNFRKTSAAPSRTATMPAR